MPDDLVPQIPVIRRVFEGFRVPVLIAAGDRGRRRHRHPRPPRRGARARRLHLHRRQGRPPAPRPTTSGSSTSASRRSSTSAALKADWGVGPEQVVDLLALTGDTVDNVPGVPGIGLKTGAKLLEEFGTLENLLANVDKVSGAKQQGEPPRARRDGPAGPPARSPSATTCRSSSTGTPSRPAARRQGAQGALHRVRVPPVPRRARPDAEKPAEAEPGRPTTGSSTRPRRSGASSPSCAASPGSASTPRRPSLDPLRADLVGLSFSWKAGEAYYLPVRGPPTAAGCSTASGDARGARGRSWPIPAIEKVGQNLKYDMLVLGRAGIEIAGPVTDTMVLSYLLESGERNHNLDQLSQRLLDHAMIPITDLIGKGKNQLTMDQVEVAKVADYAGEDADATWRIEAILAPKVREEGLWDLYADLERPLDRASSPGWRRPASRSTSTRLEQLSREFAARLATIEAEIYALAGPRVQHRLAARSSARSSSTS